MTSLHPLLQSRLTRAALLLTAITSTAHAAEQVVDASTANINVAAGDTVWFDSANNNVPIPLGTINSATPATGSLPGWAHTRWSFMKYDGANVIEIPNGEKILGNALLGTATATSDYYDNAANSTLNASQSIGFVETTRDFAIANGATLDIAKGGLIFHNNSHWMKNGTGGGFVTSSSGQLVVVANGGSTDYQINTIAVKDFNGTTPLTLVKTGPDHLNLSNIANTYTGGTYINNGRLRASNTASYGAGGTVRVTGTNSQACLAAGGNFGQSFEIAGSGWTEPTGGNKLGALRFESSATVTGSVSLTADSRITVDTPSTGAINGTLSGSSALELGLAGVSGGTLNLNGSGSGMTGPVAVAFGRLNLNSSLGGTVTVASNAGLGGEGTIAGSLSIGGATGASNLYVNGSTPGSLAVSGLVNLGSGPTTINVVGTPSAGTSFTAFTYGSLNGSVSNLTVTGLRGGSVSDDSANSRVLVNYTPGTLTWTGSANANWTQNADLNFDNGAATNFFTGDNVSFTEAATVKTLAIVGIVFPGSVSFNHSSDYTVTAANAGIGGSTGLTKSGSGTLTLSGPLSTFTGPVAVNGGRLKFGGNAEALGNSSGITVAAGAQVDFAGNTPANAGRNYDWTIAGNGPDGLGAITNSAANSIQETAGIRNVTLSADASIGGNSGRFDVGNGAGTAILTGNGHTLTKVGSVPVGFRTNASGSPVNFVIAAGKSWGENTDAAWGGATGTLRVKSGAAAGTYGTRSISTPVFLEAGSSLYNEGGGKGTWTGNVVLQGAATIDAANAAMDLTGTVSGAFPLAKTGGFAGLISVVQYTGDTTISAGVLSLGTATLGDSTTVSIAATAGTKLDLPHGLSDTVKVLIIGGVPQIAGTWGSTASAATNKDDNHFSGTGMLNVTTSGDPYQAWAAANGIPGAGAAVDSDNDGIPNGIEFVIGGNPNGPGADSALLPTVSTSDPAYLDFTFRRTDDAAGYDPYVEYSTNLSTWTTAEPGEPTLTPVLIDETDDFYGAGIDRVVVRIPRALAANKELFARLRVDIP